MEKYNKNFVKTKDGFTLEFAPSEFDFKGVHYNATNDEEIYNAMDYFRLERTEAPSKEGFYFTPFYELENNVLLQKWEEHENPPEEEDSFELLDIITEGVIE